VTLWISWIQISKCGAVHDRVFSHPFLPLILLSSHRKFSDQLSRSISTPYRQSSKTYLSLFSARSSFEPVPEKGIGTTPSGDFKKKTAAELPAIHPARTFSLINSNVIVNCAASQLLRSLQPDKILHDTTAASDVRRQATTVFALTTLSHDVSKASFSLHAEAILHTLIIRGLPFSLECSQML
jgi:hypothetical protein